MSRFYSMSYRDVMGMPIKAFWTYNAQISRLRAEEALEKIDLFMLGGMGVTAETLSEMREGYLSRMGEPMKVIQNGPAQFSLEEQQAGLDKLRGILSQIKKG